MRKILFLLFAISATLNYGQIKSETYEPVLPTSPNVEEFTKYVNFPVNHYTGVPNINIPIYSLSVKEVQADVSLSYHAGGIRVNERASWVGLGWNLNAGGIITREVRGTPDDLEYGYTDPTTGVGQDMEAFFAADLNILPENEDFVKNIRTQAADGWIDTQPDIYTFRVGGLSGRFVINHNGEIYQLSHSAIKISGDPQNGFQITDTSGNTYFFDQIEQTMVVPSYTTGGDDYTYNSSWHISKITNPFNQEIHFSYAPEGISFQAPLQQSISYRVIGNDQQCDPMPGTSSPNIFLNIQAKRLSQITFPSGKIKFIALTDRTDLDGNSKQLDRIEIWDTVKLLKKYEFTYDYFMPAEKLKLLSIRERSATEQAKAPFEFYYNETHPLPAINAKGQDFWGYYNGKDTNGTLLPLLPDTVAAAVEDYDPTQHADRQVDTAYTAVGTLNKIVYPTKGSTEYFYQCNTYGYIKNIPVLSEVTIDTEITGNSDLAAAAVCSGTYQSGGFVCGNMGNVEIANASHSKVSFTAPYSGDYPFDYSISDDEMSPATFVRIEDQSGAVLFSANTNGTVNNTGIALEKDDSYFLVSNIDSDNARAYIKIRRYEFESDTIVNINKYTGGLRIQKIVKKDADGTIALERQYRYLMENDTRSSGVVQTNNPPYGFPKIIRISSEGLSGVDELPCHYYYITSVPLTSYGSSQGSVAGYRRVVEKTISNQDGVSSNGESVYAFTSAYDFDDDYQFIDFPYSERISFDYRRGLLLRQTHYGIKDSGKEKVRETENEYMFFEQAFPNIWAMKAGRNTTVAFGISYADDYLTTVSLNKYSYGQSYGAYLSGSVTKTWPSSAGGDPVSVSKEILYDNLPYPQPGRQKQITNFSDTLTTKYTYPFNDLADPSMAALTDQNRIGKAVKVEKYRTDTTGNEELLSTRKTLYQDFSGLTLPQKIQLAIGTEALEDQLSYTAYDAFGNVLEIIQKDGTPISYIYGYGNTLPIVKLEGVAYSQIDPVAIADLQSLSDNDQDAVSEQNLRDALSSLRLSHPGNVFSGFTYDPLVGLTSSMDSRGNLSFFQYDTFNRLANTKDINGDIISTFDYNYAQEPAVYDPLLTAIDYGSEDTDHQWFEANISGGSGNYSYQWFEGIGDSSTDFEVSASGSSDTYQLMVDCSAVKYVKLIVTDNVTGQVVEQTKISNNSCNYLPLNISIGYGTHNDNSQNFTANVSGGSGSYSYSWHKGIGVSSFNFEVNSTSTLPNCVLIVSCTTYKWVKLVITDTVTGETAYATKKSNNSPCSGGGGNPEGPEPLDPEQ